MMGATVFGVGFAPVAPGTFGTLAALPIFWAMSKLPVAAYVGVLVVLIGLASWVSDLAEHLYDDHDLGHIVVDEFVGLLTTCVAIPFSWKSAIAAFVLFRFFDIVKPQPIRWIDDHVRGGLGVVLDDVAAGVAACIVMHIAGYVLKVKA
ncbi:MAG: phosphatidylglycerophosphatase A [Clostridia bacterium]|nr:phosphatidylglycerophosphatase A [Deltaproteobacteria bacterium]